MLELFSPFHLWRLGSYDPSQMGIYAQNAIWFIACSVLVETLVRGAEKFIAKVKGRALLWFQVRSFAELGLTYVLCFYAMYLALTALLGTNVGAFSFAGVVGLAVLPRIYTVYGLLPYIGRTLQAILNAWSLILLYLALRHGMDIESNQIWLLWGIGIGCYLAARSLFGIWEFPRKQRDLQNQSVPRKNLLGESK